MKRASGWSESVSSSLNAAAVLAAVAKLQLLCLPNCRQTYWHCWVSLVGLSVFVFVLVCVCVCVPCVCLSESTFNKPVGVWVPCVSITCKFVQVPVWSSCSEFVNVCIYSVAPVALRCTATVVALLLLFCKGLSKVPSSRGEASLHRPVCENGEKAIGKVAQDATE